MTESRVPVSAAEMYDNLGGAYEEAFGHQPSTAALDHLVEVLRPGSKVLDLGSGTGWPVAATVAAAGHEVTGYDVSETMVRLARDRVPAARFDHVDMRTLAFSRGTWDAVLVFFSMLQVPRPEQDAMVTKIAEWLAPGGYFVLGTVPSDLDGVAAEWMGHWIQVYSYSIPVLRQRLEAAGLEIVREDVAHFEPETPDAAPEPQVYLTARKPVDLTP